jgi:phage terminase large subunit-like protein
MNVEDVIRNIDAVVARLFFDSLGNPIKLTPYQKTFISEMLTRKHNKSILVSSTRVGKTEAAAILSILLAVVYDSEEIMIVAPIFKQSEELFRRIRNFVLNSPELLKFLEQKKAFRRDEINFVNGSVIRCISASNPEGLLSHGATVLIIDEAGSIPNVIWRTRLLRMLAGSAGRPKPILILLGTPQSFNFFYDCWNNPEFWRMRVTWKEGVAAGILDKEVVDFARRTMTDTEFKIWFEAEFVGQQSEMFDSKKVITAAVGSQHTSREPGFDYVIGLDIARFGEDSTAAVVVRIPTGASFEEATVEHVATYTRSKKSITDTVGWMLELSEKWQPITIVVDEIGAGAGAVDLLREKLKDRILPVHAVGNERTDIYGSLLELLEDGRIILINDDMLKDQLRSYSVKYSSDGRLIVTKDANRHNDISDALAYACYGLKRYRGETVSVSDAILHSNLLGGQPSWR